MTAAGNIPAPNYIIPYLLKLPAETTLSASVFKLTDRDPPLVRLDLSYDPFIGNPLGRYFKVAMTKEFK